MVETKNKPKKLKCPKSYCGNIWMYKGNKDWATCTNCYNKVKVETNEVKE